MIAFHGGDDWYKLGSDSGERRLLVAVIGIALNDVLYGSSRLAADAMAYLGGPNFESDCAWLDLDPAIVRNLIARHDNEMQRLFTDEQIRALHQRYMNEHLTLEQLGRENNVSGATLSRIFSRAGLAIRPRGHGNPRRPTRAERDRPPTQSATPAESPPVILDVVPLNVSVATDSQSADRLTLHELTQLLADLNAAGASLHGTVRLQIDLEVQL